MSWTNDDVREWKEKCSEILGKKVQSEKGLYLFLATWIKNKHTRTKVFFKGQSKSMILRNSLIPRYWAPPSVDVIEVDRYGKVIGYEVKMVHEGLQTTYIIQGIGQAINYLYQGVDCAYLVAPQVEELYYLPDLLKKATPYLGLILFNNVLNFEEVIRAKKVKFYPSEDKRLANFLSKQRDDDLEFRHKTASLRRSIKKIKSEIYYKKQVRKDIETMMNKDSKFKEVFDKEYQSTGVTYLEASDRWIRSLEEKKRIYEGRLKHLETERNLQKNVKKYLKSIK